MLFHFTKATFMATFTAGFMPLGTSVTLADPLDPDLYYYSNGDGSVINSADGTWSRIGTGTSTGAQWAGDCVSTYVQNFRYLNSSLALGGLTAFFCAADAVTTGTTSFQFDTSADIAPLSVSNAD